MDQSPVIVNHKNGQYELAVDKIDSPLWNHDLHPIKIESRTWTKWTMMSLWIAMCITITTYMLGSSLIGNGMNWWEAVITIALGNIIVLIPMALIAHPGPKYGVPFPVLIRSSFGLEGAKIIALLRAFVACGWFGINVCIAGNALFLILTYIFPSIKNSIFLGDFIGLDLFHLISLLLMVIIHAIIIHFGIQVIKKFEVFIAPFLLLLGFGLLGLVCIKVGSFLKLLEASKALSLAQHINFWTIFWPGLTAIVGFWSTLALNIPDFTRFVKSQKDQVIGQAIALPITMALFSFIGIAITSATIIIFGKAIWDPVEVIKAFGNNFLLIIPLIGLILATICCNMAANVVSPANDFSNLFPKFISFKTGGYITCVIGIIIFPWKLIADPQGYIFKWLIAYSALLGGVGGIMIADYYIIRKTKLNLVDLFNVNGEYVFTKGWNLKAFAALLIGILPNIPGFLIQVGLVNSNFFPAWIGNFYNYAWFTAFFISFIMYVSINKIIKSKFLIPWQSTMINQNVD